MYPRGLTATTASSPTRHNSPSLTDAGSNTSTAFWSKYLLGQPAGGRRQYEGETYFCWIGKYSDEDLFYFRIQSPVILVEFNHHSGVF
jgi:hypothetical protein